MKVFIFFIGLSFVLILPFMRRLKFILSDLQSVIV